MKHKKMEYCTLYESLNYIRREQEAMNENLTTTKSKQLMLRSFHQMVYNLVQNSTNCEMETGWKQDNVSRSGSDCECGMSQP